jgi:hypothetical protein
MISSSSVLAALPIRHREEPYTHHNESPASRGYACRQNPGFENWLNRGCKTPADMVLKTRRRHMLGWTNNKDDKEHHGHDGHGHDQQQPSEPARKRSTIILQPDPWGFLRPCATKEKTDRLIGKTSHPKNWNQLSSLFARLLITRTAVAVRVREDFALQISILTGSIWKRRLAIDRSPDDSRSSTALC